MLDHEQRERRAEAHQRLAELRRLGFRYVVSNNDGSFWVGSKANGLEIQSLLASDFLGHVVVDPEESSEVRTE